MSNIYNFDGELHHEKGYLKGKKSKAAKQALKDICEDKEMRVMVNCGSYDLKMPVILDEDILQSESE